MSENFLYVVPVFSKYNFLLIWQIYASIICAYQKIFVPLQAQNASNRRRKNEKQREKTMKKILVILLGAALVGCGQKEFTIGVSQCQDDAWRQKMNAEMQRELLYHPDMHLVVREAQANNELQCAQIDSFIREGVDLLIVSPNEAEAVKPAVSRAYKAGIPVIVADRRVTGDEWTAFVGGDNVAVGRMMGQWVLEKEAQAGRPLKIIEIVGLPGSTPAVLRHQGLMEMIGEAEAGDRVISGEGEWMQEDARHTMEILLQQHSDVDLVLAQNDLMAIGASRALLAKGKKGVPVMGVDGIDLGLKAIVDGDIEATTTYASRGDMVIQTASQILHGEAFVRDTVLQTTIIDAQTAKAMLQVSEQNAHDVATIQFMQQQLEDYWLQSKSRFTLFGIIVLLLIILFAMVIRYLIKSIRSIREETETEPVQSSGKKIEDTLTPRIRAYVDAHLSDPDLSVELLSEEMGMSRAQLFRKTKAVSGKAPVEIIREQRLKKAKELLQTTDWTIQQVAYEVGFTSPSYFTKCYKEQYGESPKK